MKKMILLLLLTTIFSCQKNSDINDLQEAQLCLNNAPASSAAIDCVSKLAGNTSENAYKLRCASIFISKGFGAATNIASAIEQMNSSTGSCTGGCSGSVGAMTTLNFGSDTTSATNLVNECTKSGVSIYSQISSVFYIGTQLYSLAGVGTPTADQLEAQISSLSASDLGSLVSTVYTSGCQSGQTNTQNQQYCNELTNVIGSGYTNTQIGTCLKARLDNPSYTGPSCP